jgi:hypothetical protein
MVKIDVKNIKVTHILGMGGVHTLPCKSQGISSIKDITMFYSLSLFLPIIS